jgi:hypothetical protein
MVVAGCSGDADADGGADAMEGGDGSGPAGANSASDGRTDDAGGAGGGAAAAGDGDGEAPEPDYMPDGFIAEGVLELLRQLTDDPYVMVGAQASVSIEKTYQFSLGYDAEFDLPTGTCSVTPTIDGKWFVTADFDESLSSRDDVSFSLWTVDGFSDAGGSDPGIQWGVSDGIAGDEWSLVPKGVAFFGCDREGAAQDAIRCEFLWAGQATTNFEPRRSAAQVHLTCIFAAPDSRYTRCLAEGCADDGNPCTLDTCTADGCEHLPLGDPEPLFFLGDNVPPEEQGQLCETEGGDPGRCVSGSCRTDPCDGQCPLEFTFEDDGRCTHTTCDDSGESATCATISHEQCPWTGE